MTIKNPIEWTGAQFVHAAHAIGLVGHSLHHIGDTIHSPAPVIRRIGLSDLTTSLREGFDDFGACRSDVIFLCVTYAVAGLVLARLAFGMNMLPLLFPLASGFALIGPIAGLGLYEMSRERERGMAVTWASAFDVARAPAAGAILVLAIALIGLFLLWQAVAWSIYTNTLGPALPSSFGAFAHDVLYTHAGHMMIVIGVGVGFLFAALTLAISIVSFPLLLDRDVGLDTAIMTSLRTVAANPLATGLWGLIVAAGLVLGTLPFFIGLVVVIPVLGHATWHLYRKLVW